MTPEQAQFLRDFSTQVFASEAETNKRVIAAIPTGQEAYKPAEKSMTAIELAHHIASADVWFLSCIAKGKFESGGEAGEKPSTVEAVLAWYTENLAAALARINAMSAEQLAAPLDFFGMMTQPTATFIPFAVRHSVHHRGQLSVYLRPMGAKVPGIYGPSADSE